MHKNRDPLSSLPFVGFRKDRLGARVIALLNVIRIKKMTECEGRFLWLSEPTGPYPDLADPSEFFSEELIDSHIRIVTKMPDLSDRRLMSMVAGSMSRDVFQRSLNDGKKYYTDSNLVIDRLMDETPESTSRVAAKIASDFKLSEPVERCLKEVREKIAEEWPDVAPIAIHVRRGDILDDNHWSRTAWPSKYVPDEFYDVVIRGAAGRVLAFSDTPDAVRHLTKDNPRVIIVDELLQKYDLTRAARDLVELWLMADCQRVFAPLSSAFSSAAEAISNTPGIPLPAGLRKPLRTPAYDALVQRVIRQPESFYHPGDLAQSTHRATSHGIAGGMDAATFHEFVEICTGRVDLMDAHPFLYKDMALAALKLGQDDLAGEMAQAALSSPHLQQRDAQGCRVVLLEIQMKSVPPERAATFQDPSVCEAIDLLFGSPGFGRRAMEVALWPMAKRGGAVSDLLLIDQPALQDVLTRRNAFVEDNPASIPQTAPDAWLVLSEWSELVQNIAMLGRIIPADGLSQRQKFLSPTAIEVEERLHKGDLSGANEQIAEGGPDLWRALGLFATQLRLYGRLNRSFAVLQMLTPYLPDNPLHLKRLASTNAAASTWPTAMNYLNQAIAVASQPGLLYLTKGIWLQNLGNYSEAQDAYIYAVENSPEIRLIRRRAALLKKAIRAAG